MSLELPRSGGLTSLVAGTVTVDLFLASKVAKREGWDGGLKLQYSGDGGVGVEGDDVDVGGISTGFFSSLSFIVPFLEEMVMDCRVVL